MWILLKNARVLFFLRWNICNMCSSDEAAASDELTLAQRLLVFLFLRGENPPVTASVSHHIFLSSAQTLWSKTKVFVTFWNRYDAVSPSHTAAADTFVKSTLHYTVCPPLVLLVWCNNEVFMLGHKHVLTVRSLSEVWLTWGSHYVQYITQRWLNGQQLQKPSFCLRDNLGGQRAPYVSAAAYCMFPLQRHRMQTPILLVCLDRLKYNTFHRQELSVSLGVIIRRYERWLRQLCRTEQVLFCPLSQCEVHEFVQQLLHCYLINCEIFVFT